MLSPLAKNRRLLKDYFVASSIEEAIAYLVSHRGEAQIVGGGTYLMKHLQRERISGLRLVDVSRISAMRRISVDGRHMLVGGAVTLEQLLQHPTVIDNLAILGDAAAVNRSPQLRHLATLAGSLVTARGNSPSLVALTALETEVEVTNLTGPQWLPLSAIWIRPGVSRVNTMSELITMIRIRLLRPGQGAALASLACPGQHHASAPSGAVIVGLERDHSRLDWLSLNLGLPNKAPQIWHLDGLLDGQTASHENARKAIVAGSTSYLQAEHTVPADQVGDHLSSATEAIYNRALERAFARLPG